mmetsp:Transcript_4466/g.13369  ORF Transcript_4466/g.13369 Transcript_4466/m.13369 type:complete len:267 (+) Transcript_4466:329-1129(+)
MSAALAWSRVDMNMLNLGTSKFPGNLSPTEETWDKSCFFFFFFGLGCSASAPSVGAWSGAAASSSSSSRSCGSSSRVLSSEKDIWFRMSPRSTRDRSVSIMIALLLIDRISSRSAASSSFDTRSSLFSTMRSEKATCCTASLTLSSGLISRRWLTTFFESTMHTTESMRKLSWIIASELKVMMIGAGSARPVVSSRMEWKSFRRGIKLLSARTRSPRTEQQTHPLSMDTTSSLAAMFSCTSPSSIFTSPNSFSMMAILHSFCSRKM